MDPLAGDIAAPTMLPVAGALLLAVPRHPWRWLRTVITIAHEGGHVVAGLVVGRRLRGIRLHSDASGLTLSRGRPTGPGMVLTTFAGYVAPSLLGLLAAVLVYAGYYAIPLLAAIACLAAMLIAIRTVFGVVAVLLLGGVLMAVRWYTPEAVQQAAASLLAWFLLVGGLRAVLELPRTRRASRSRETDADQLARLTSVPAVVWIAAFALVAIGALIGATALLLHA